MAIGSCGSKEFRCSDLKEKEGGIYTEHRVISFSSVTETATACRSVLSLISRWGKDELTRIELPPEALRQSE